MDPAPRRRWRITPKDNQAGQGLVEYALIFVLIVIVAIASLTFFGTAVSGYLSSIGTSI
jgi:pilus assembly protein Flp/PilA